MYAQGDRVLGALRARARMNAVGVIANGAEADELADLVDRRLMRLDPVPRFLLRAGECVAAVPVVGVSLPGGRQYVGIVSGLAVAFQMERGERA